jgi:hypothetical protein
VCGHEDTRFCIERPELGCMTWRTVAEFIEAGWCHADGVRIAAENPMIPRDDIAVQWPPNADFDHAELEHMRHRRLAEAVYLVADEWRIAQNNCAKVNEETCAGIREALRKAYARWGLSPNFDVRVSDDRYEVELLVRRPVPVEPMFTFSVREAKP